MGKDLHHSEEMGGHLVPLNSTALEITWFAQNSIDVWCFLVGQLSQREAQTEMISFFQVGIFPTCDLEEVKALSTQMMMGAREGNRVKL